MSRLPKPKIEDYTEWVGRVLRRAFFPDQKRAGEVFDPPASTAPWVNSLDGDDKNHARRILELHDEMVGVAQDMMAVRVEPTVEQYDALIDRLDQLVTFLDQFQYVSETPAQGRIDPVTGMRSEVGMHDDLARELERRARKGTPFCVGMCRIDNMRTIKEKYLEEDIHFMIKHVAMALKNTLRPFDDIYHVGDGEFVLSLKDTDSSDSFIVTDRIREGIQDSSVLLSGNNSVQITVSFGVTDPMEGDEDHTMIDCARQAVSDAQSYGGNKVVQYEEISPLVKFVRERKQD